MRSLVPCTQCARHVDAHANVCPFCAAPLAVTAPRPRIVRALTRAAIFASAAACTSSHPSPQAPETRPIAPDTTASDTRLNDLRGYVLQGRRPGAYIGLVITKIDDPSVERRVTSAADGSYIATDLPPGTYRVQVTPANPNDNEEHREVTIAPGRGAKLDIALPPAAYEPVQIPKPYGAPPARRRMV